MYIRDIRIAHAQIYQRRIAEKSMPAMSAMDIMTMDTMDMGMDMVMVSMRTYQSNARLMYVKHAECDHKKGPDDPAGNSLWSSIDMTKTYGLKYGRNLLYHSKGSDF